MLLNVAARLAAQTIAPELPRATVATAMPPSTGAVISVPAGGNLQAALMRAKGGDVVELACGATYAGTFMLPDKGANTAWTIVRPAKACAPPPAGTRMTPALAARLPRLVSADAGYAIATSLGAHHWRLIGLDIGVGGATARSYGIVGLGSDAGQGQRARAQAAHHLILDRVYVHGRPDLPLRRCIALNSATTAIIDSWVSDCHDEGADAQAIGGWNGPGPFLIENNELQASTEIIMFGGSDAAAAELSPADIVIRRNHLFKPIAWKGGRWLIKTLFELKNAKRVLLEGNVAEGNWPQAWDGTGFTIKSVNQDGSAPWSGTTDVTIRLNIVRHTGGGMNLHSDPERSKRSVPVARVAITDNMMLGLDSDEYPGSGKAFYFGGHIDDLRVEHNTVTWAGRRGASDRAIEYEGDPPEPFARTTITNNLFATAGGVGLLGQRLGYPGPVWAAWGRGGTFAGNVFALGTPYATGEWNQWVTTMPHGNRVLVSNDTLFAAIGFAHDRSLAPTSRWKGSATDGRDPGADVAAVLAATAGVAEGAR
jgi:hypothetical protein